ncbi:cytochrome C biogenesis protein CcdA [Thalassotalea insulae]|uniref:Cytochrome C biogenesis protein CcdA n=1 Tax=Thalassotalea insulae TaxID=2056778 RepID=A0ABQ6GVG9_9GAMM|nr:cytochrome c biogenesis protein CcdA [Thalassotalea insulae]GLX79920.1 cytochrome C biogenesis protein CcdA [Thalassotalea insulae]
MEFIESLIQSYLSTGELSFVAIALVFFAGVLTSATPCVYPMIPITVGIFGYESKNKANNKLGPVFYIGGLAVIYGGLGVFAASTGKLFGEISTSPFGYILIANLCLIFAAWMMGWVNFPNFTVAQNVQNRFSHPYIRLFLMGGASGLVAAPCTAPVLGMLLLYIASKGDIVYGAILMISFAYGLGALLLLLAFSSQWFSRLPKPGPWMKYNKYLMSLIMLLSAEYFLVEASKLLF